VEIVLVSGELDLAKKTKALVE